MKRFSFVLLAALCLGACAETQYALDPEMNAAWQEQRTFDTWAVESQMEASEKAAIIEQHALFPYHFIPGSAALTELGQRDFALLAENYKMTPGPLALIKSDTPDELYARRKEAISAALQQSGLASVTLTDGPVGGRGITGEAAVKARRETKDKLSDDAGMDTGSASNTVGGN